MSSSEPTDPLAYLSDLDRERQCYALLQRLVHCERSYWQAHAGMGRSKQEQEEWTAKAWDRMHDASEAALVFLNRHREELDDARD